MIIIGIFLAVLAAALGTTSKQLIAASTHYKKLWLFHLGAGMNIAVGPIVDASAYAFAPQVIVAPFACLDVIFNALTAPYTLKWQGEVLTRVHVIGSGLVAAGAVFTSVFADASNEVYTVDELEHQLLRPASIIYLSTELSAIITVNVLLKRGLMNPQIRGISLGVVAGVLMGNVFFMKGLLGFVRRGIQHGDWSAFIHLTPYVCLVCAVCGAVVGHIFMRKGLGEYKGVFMVTIFEGAHITAACLSGCIVMSEMSGATWWKYIMYWCGVSLIISGLLVINTKAAESKMAKPGGNFHIAQNFVDEDLALKDNVDPSPIGNEFDPSPDQRDMEIDMVVDAETGMEGKTSSTDDGREVSPARDGKGETGETQSNVSTSTPEGELPEATPNGNSNSPENAAEAPVFSGQV
jgi:hypothetical protein